MSVIRIISEADGRRGVHSGQYLMDYDPNAYGGRGTFTTTPDKQRARRFPNAVAALELWRKPADPPYDVRLDGKPNRPLTALTVTVEPD